MDNIESQSVKSLVLTLVKKGVSLSVADGKLKLTGPVSTLSSALKAQIKDNKQAIIDYVQTVHLQQTKPKITRIDNTQPAPLSYVQQQLYFIDQYQEQSAQYNMPAAFKLEGPLDIALAEQAIKHILLRHQVLRTVYQKGAPAGQFDVIQQVQAEPEFVLKDINLRHLPESEQQQQLHALLEQDIQTPFCLHTDLLLRASHISIRDHGQPCAVLLFNMHHIAGDGWSMELLLKEFVIHYQSLATQGCISAASLPTLPIQYRDYAHWQRQYLSGEVLQQKLNYWQTHLAGIEPEHSIPLDVERSASQSTQPHAKRITTKLSGDTASRLQALAKSFDLTPFMLLYGAVCAAIARFSNTEDVVIGSPVANRTESELENLIGCFINSIVLRVNTASSSISEYLSQVRTVHLDALKHQDLPFSLLVESLELERNPEIHPVFQIMFSTNTDFGVKNEHVKKDNDELVPGVKLSPIAPPVNIAKFDLDIAASVSGSEITFSWLYNSAIFSPQKIQRIAQHTQLWLTRLADLDEAQCATYSTDVLNALSEEEESKLLTTLQPSRDIPEPPSSLLHECVTIQAQKTPDDTALVNINSAGEENSLSYEQLTNYSNSLARYLIAHGVKPDMRVALFSNNSLELIVSILAILKAGGAYLAIDPSTPEDRLEYILADADVSIVLTQTALQHLLPSAVSMTLNVDSTLISKVLETYSTEPVSTAENTLNPHNLAYTIYTSGSTGKPKGVLVEHHAISTHIAQISHAYQIQPRQRILSFPSISFDVSIELMFSSLCSGATLYLKDNAIWTANQFYEYLLSHQIHSVDVAPAYLAELLIESEASLQFWQNTQLRLLLVGGEAFPQNLRDKWFQIADKTGIDGRCRLLNAYGPTECLITSTLHEITRSDGIIPIGQGVGSRRLYVLDEHHRLLPEGAVGELYVSGPLNARGYLNRPDLTEQRFLADPFTQDDQDTMYQTGDLVRWLPQGELEYLGRVDEQVKIRGFRIELGEIANTLMQIAQVDSAEVLAIETKSGQKQLVAFVKQSHPGSLSEAQMRDTLQHALSQTLPHYMVPSAYSFIEEWPTTTSGKVDKKQLRHTFKLTATAMFEDEGPYVAPTTPLEQQLVEIWSEVLTQPAEQVSIHANFFALGGHSLLTMRLISQIHQACHLELNVKEVFNHPTIAEQAKLLALKTPSDDTKIPALPRNVHGDVLSFSQHRLWFINQLRGQTSEYNMPSAFILKGQIEPALLERALNLVIQRHEVLHTVYRQSEGVAKQHVMTEYEFQLTQIDLSSLDEAHQQQRLLALAQQDANTPFDLSAGPIIRASFVALHKAQHQSITSGALLLNMHHIASDGWSMSILLRELTQYYIALLDNSAQPETVLPPLPIQYADYAIWQRAHFDETVLQEQLSYWQTQLSDLPEMHSLPLKAERPEVKQSQADIVSCDLSQSLCKNLSQLAHHHGMTPFMLLHSALAQVLSMHSGSDDIVIGTVTAGRQPAVEQLIGFFINTLVLRVNTGAHNTGHLRDYLSHVKDVHTQAQANQDVPFEQLVEKLQPQRDAAYTPLFQIVLTTDADFLTTQNASYSSHPSVQIEPMTTNDIRLKFDIELNMSMNTAGGKVTWLYDCHLFDKSYIEKINAHLCHYLSALAELVDGEHVIDKPLNELTMLSQAEQHHALSVLNGPIRDYPHTGIDQLVSQQAQSRPDAIAVRCADETLTYAQLELRATQLATHLVQHHQVLPQTLIGIHLGRSCHMVIAMLGILKAGCAYVPLDPDYPFERLAYMVEDTALSCIVSDAVHQSTAEDLDKPLIRLDALDMTCADIPPLNIGSRPDHLAYVIYTSGSTGRPKGVMIEHRSLVNTIVDNAERFGVTSDSGFYQSTAFGFDAATWVTWLTLSRGATLVLSTTLDYQSELTSKYGRQVTHLMMTPSALQLVSPDAVAHIKHVIVGGEACDTQLVDRWAPTASFYNAYGPTETAICATIRQLSSGEKPVLGRANANTQLLVLNKQGQLLPTGAIGELYIAGDGLARGYLNKPELTAQAFVKHPYRHLLDITSERMYKTGDLVRILPNNELEFLGRVDEQVKIRGFRVELGEIEKQLTQLPDIDAAVVQIQKDQYGQAHLVAYIQQNSTTCEPDIRAALCQQLPDYMLPSHFVVLQTWPLTANGKLDKKALPKVDFELRSGASISPPQTPLEQELVNAWTNVLGREADTIGIDDNFFSLGGHSLLSVKLLDAIRQFSQVNLSVKDIFKYPTIRELANYIAQIDDSPCGQSINKIQRSAAGHALSYAQQRLWFIDSVQGATSEYNMPFAFRLTGNVNPTYIERAFQHILQRHEVLRSVYREVDGTIRQHPLDNMTFNLSRHDLSHLSGDKQTHALKQLMVQDASTSFSLQDDLMLRATYVHLDKTPQATQAVLLVNMHHIASDGWSVSVLMKEFLTLYNAQLKVATPIHDLDDVLPELTIQYIDFAHWQRNWLSNGVLDEQLAYWKTQLADLPALHSLPLDMPRPVVKQTKAQGITGHLPAHVSASLCQLAEHFQLTPFMLLHAALAQVIAHYSHNEDVTVGTVVANRGLPQTNDLVGFFVNTLVLRVSASPTQPLSSYLHHIKQVHTQAQINQDVPFEQLVDSLQPERNTAFSPLFQIALSSNSGLGELFDVIDEGQSNDMQISTLLNDERSLKFDLEINVHMNKSGGVLSWVYDSALFNKVSIDRLNNHLCHYLSEWSKLVDGEHVIDKPLNELTMLSQAEQHHALSVLNGPIRDYPHTGIDQLVSQQAQSRPDAIAVRCADETLTYAQLELRATQLATHLVQHHQVLPQTLIGIHLGRSCHMVIAMLGILKAGCAYVPLDPDYPFERLAYMVEDTALSCIVSDAVYQSTAEDLGKPLIRLDALDMTCTDIPPLNTGSRPDHLAYVIYTSGSTGRPKGVMIEHRSLVNTIVDNAERIGVTSDSGFYQSTAFGFDAATWVTWVTLSRGATLMLSTTLDYQSELTGKYGHQVSHVMMTPSALQLVSPDAVAHIKHVVVAGEACDAQLVDRWAPTVNFYNAYGPTETAICATIRQLSPGEKPVLGRANANTQLLVLNEQGQLLPTGAIGELYIAGDGLARGYLNKPELTAQAFVQHPYRHLLDVTSERMYKTGDLVRILPNNELEFLGRVDEQVKIRGFRVELGEIEKQLTQLPDIDAAVVQIQKDQHGQAYLVAYIQQNSTTCESDIRAALRQQLPDYMQPSHFVVLQTWPLTANGKLDKKALPKVDFELHSGASISPPKTPLEHALIKAWQAAKPIEQPCVTTPLFAQGVDSLSLVKIKHHITLAGFDVSMQQVMTHQTIRALAQSIEKGEKAHTKPTPIVRLNQSSATTLLYLIHPYGGGVEMYRELAQQLQPQAKVYGLVAPFMSGQTVQFNDLDELAKRYTQTIQAHIQENANSETKLVLGGFSYGGALSSLITEQLIEQNIPVDSLLMFDSSTENLKKSTQHHFVDRMCNILSAMEIPLPDDATMAMWRNDPAQHQALCAEYMHQKFAGQISDLDIKAFIDFHDQLELAEAINQHVNQDVPVHLFYNRDHVGAQSNIARWKARYSNNLHAYPMGFNHHEFMSEDAVKQIMTMLKEVL